MMVPSCCALLATHLGHKISFPDDTAYKAVEASYWSTQEASLAPACIATPKNSKDVATFLSVVTSAPVCDFAIKSQGHAPGKGFANIKDGVTLDTTVLNTTTISADHSVAHVGPGSAWVNVYRTLNRYNKTVAGGRNGAVGVGGLTVGGGVSYYSPQVGFTCDTVKNFEVVLASSKIVNANATSSPDLYRALKGGASNFGIVTRIDFETVDVVDLYAGRLFNEAKYVDRVLGAFAGIATAANYDVHASIVTSLAFNSTTKAWSVVNIPVYTKPNRQPPIYRELFSIPNITSLTSFSIQNISTLANEPPYPQKYESFFTSTYAATSTAKTTRLLRTFYEIANATLNSPSSPAGVGWGFAFEPLPTVLTRHGANKNVLGFQKHSQENQIILLLSPGWTDHKVSKAVHRTGETLIQKLDRAAEQMGMLRRFKYLNYANIIQDPFRSYGKKNLIFLRNTSRKYDPKGVFQDRVPGGFKLFAPSTRDAEYLQARMDS